MKVNAHQRYRLLDGQIVPGVTTITALQAKPALIAWGNRIGLDGVDLAKYVDNSAAIGTLSHRIITDSLQGFDTDYRDHDENQIKAAKTCVQSYECWSRGKEIKPKLIETSLVSEEYGYGGTPDIYADVDGKKTLVDLKTSVSIWPEHVVQISAYKQLLTEAGHMVDTVRILCIPRSGVENFSELIVSDEALVLNFELFLNLLRIYKIQRELK